MLKNNAINIRLLNESRGIWSVNMVYTLVDVNIVQ